MIPALPKPLQPWAEALSIVRHEVIDGVGTWLAPLRMLVGPLAIPRSTESGDPDGLSGLTRRGAYERLVVSEWALALEVPDEFLRRALMGEHVFLARAFQEPHGAHGSVALLDVGPMQLGAPRLVQLAALIVLAQRAEDCGARFRFGMLQDDERRLHAVDRDGLLAWSRTRSAACQPEALDGWTEALEDAEASDRWVVGASSLRAVASELRAGLIAVEEPLEPGSRALEVSVQRTTAPGGRVALQRPDDDDGVRILRHPVRPPSMPAGVPSATAPRDGLGQLVLRGDRLVVRRSDGVVLAHHAPHGPGGRGPAKEVHPIAWTGTPIGLDIYSGRLVALMIAKENSLAIGGSGLGSGPSGNSVSIVEDLGPLPECLSPWDEQLVALLVGQAHRDRLHAWFIVGERHLFEIDYRAKNEGEVRPLDPWICAYARYEGGRLAWISAGQRTILSNVGSASGEPPPIPQEVLEDVVLGPWQRGHPWPSFAYRTGENRITAFGMQPEPVEVTIDPGCRMVGLTSRTIDATRHMPIPILQRPTNDRIVRHGEHEALFVTTSPIAATRWYPANDILVWRTRAGEVGVDAIQPHRAQLRLRPEGRRS